MQKKDEKKKLGMDRENSWFSGVVGIYAAFFLSACTTNPVPDEEFEAPTGNFPLLGNVPDRPAFPLLKDIAHQQRRLQGEHDQATRKQGDVIKSIKP